MSRRHKPPPDMEAAAERVDKVMQWGYYTMEFSPYHIRIQDAVDYWPTSGKWRAPKGYNFDREGLGLPALKKYLNEYHPLSDAPK